MSNRCSCCAVTTSRIYKKRFAFVIQEKKFCHIHARYKFNKHVILIQKFWRGYKARHLITHIYNKLPDDLQKKILFYVRENYLIKKHHYDVITRILDTKIDKRWIAEIICSLRNSDIIFNEANLNKLALTYKLYSKYFEIASQQNINMLYTNVQYLQEIFLHHYINPDLFDKLYTTALNFENKCNDFMLKA